MKWPFPFIAADWVKHAIYINAKIEMYEFMKTSFILFVKLWNIDRLMYSSKKKLI